MERIPAKISIEDSRISNITNIANPLLNKQIVKTIISKSELNRIINRSEISDLSPYSKSNLGSIGIQPTLYFSLEECKQYLTNLRNRCIIN